jgi:hypothetical protein
MKLAKIFGVGLNKTGTTTLGQCGALLGLNCTSFDRDLLHDVVKNKNLDRVEEIVGNYDLFEDWPWPLLYRELDEMFPGSKFILTTRVDSATWLNSLKAHSMRTSPLHHPRKMIYGYNYPHGNEEYFLDFYTQHNNDVREYFKDRPNDFREFCWEQGDGIDQLCSFLGMDLVQQKMPHANRSKDNEPSLINGFLNGIFKRF